MERFWVVTDERDGNISFVAFSNVSRIIPVLKEKDEIYCYIETKDGKRERVCRQNEHELPTIINEDEIIYFLQNHEYASDLERLYRESTEEFSDNDNREEYIFPEEDKDPLTTEDIMAAEDEDLQDLIQSAVYEDELDEEVRSFLQD